MAMAFSWSDSSEISINSNISIKSNYDHEL